MAAEHVKENHKWSGVPDQDVINPCCSFHVSFEDIFVTPTHMNAPWWHTKFDGFGVDDAGERRASKGRLLGGFANEPT